MKNVLNLKYILKSALCIGVIAAPAFAAAMPVQSLNLMKPPELQGLPTREQLIDELGQNHLVCIWTLDGLMIVWTGGTVEVPWSDMLSKYGDAIKIKTRMQ